MKYRLCEIRLNRGGYDSTGAYWGVGQRLYEWEDDNGNSEIFRAKDREALPDATFYR